jgi:hypothetical protein
MNSGLALERHALIACEGSDQSNYERCVQNWLNRLSNILPGVFAPHLASGAETRSWLFLAAVDSVSLMENRQKDKTNGVKVSDD